jgi:hypothetical protein
LKEEIKMKYHYDYKLSEKENKRLFLISQRPAFCIIAIDLILMIIFGVLLILKSHAEYNSPREKEIRDIRLQLEETASRLYVNSLKEETRYADSLCKR